MAHSFPSQLFVNGPGEGPGGRPSPLRPIAGNGSAGLEDLRARIRRYNGGLDPAGQSFQAALVLLAGSTFGQNVDLIARRTGLERAFVSRCARRLIDNGVWVSGRIVAEWAADDPASGSFWSDVAVAEGKMCRRVRGDGTLEWAPAGFWNKNFHFLDPDAENRLGTLYLDPTGPAAALKPDLEEIAEAEEQASATGDAPAGNGSATAPEDLEAGPGDGAAPELPAHRSDTPATVEDVRAGSGSAEEDADDLAGAEAEVETSPEPAPSLRHVFRDAVWIG